MKIAVLRQRPAGGGGAETTLAHLAAGFLAAGHEVAVYGSEAAAVARGALPPGCRYAPVPVWGGKAFKVLTYALNARRLLQAAAPEVVFSLERVPGVRVFRAGDGCHREWLARRSPHLSLGARAAQRLSLFHRVVLLLEKRLFADPGLAGVIANSRQVREEIIRHYRVDPALIRVIYNGLDRERFRPLEAANRAALKSRLGAPPGTEIVLFVGSGFKRKGLAYLIAAFSSLTGRNSVLWVVGRGNSAPYQRQTARLGIADRVKFLGPQADPAPFYQAATVVALPTIYDPCSNAVLEALACGAPVVTTAANGAQEFITAGENGAVLVHPQDLAGLKLALAEYLDRGRDPRVRQASRDAVAPLSWERTVAETLALLQEVASSR